MVAVLPPNGTKFVSRKKEGHTHTLEWAIADRKSSNILTEFKADQKKAKAVYHGTYGPTHLPRGE